MRNPAITELIIEAGANPDWTDDEIDEYFKRLGRKDLIKNIFLGIVVSSVIIVSLWFFCLGMWITFDWITDKGKNHFLGSAKQINQTEELVKKDFKVRAIIQDNKVPWERDEYIAQILNRSDCQYFNNLHYKVGGRTDTIIIYFIDQNQWDGQKICGNKKGMGCTQEFQGQKIIYMSLTQNFEADLKTLNHERAHAYFQNEPEMTAELIDHVFGNEISADEIDARRLRFNLWKDDEGHLRISE